MGSHNKIIHPLFSLFTIHWKPNYNKTQARANIHFNLFFLILLQNLCSMYSSDEFPLIFSGKQEQDNRLPCSSLSQIKTAGVGTGWKDGWLFVRGKTAFSTSISKTE